MNETIENEVKELSKDEMANVLGGISATGTPTPTKGVLAQEVYGPNKRGSVYWEDQDTGYVMTS